MFTKHKISDSTLECLALNINTLSERNNGFLCHSSCKNRTVRYLRIKLAIKLGTRCGNDLLSSGKTKIVVYWVTSYT